MFDDVLKKYMNFKNVTFTLILVLFLFFIFNCKDIAIMFFASFVIACSLNPIVDKLSKKSIERYRNRSCNCRNFIINTGNIYTDLHAVF